MLIAIALAHPDSFRVTSKQSTKAGETSSEYDATLAVAVFAAGALFVLVGLLFSRISKLTLPGGAGIELTPQSQADARVAAKQTADPRDDDPRELGDSCLSLRAALEARLAWLAKHFVGPDGEVIWFATPGSLHYDGYLTDEQMRTAMTILTLPTDAKAEDEPRLRDFIESGQDLVKGIRVAALQQRTYRVLEDLLTKKDHADWQFSEDTWKRDRRPDLVVRWPGQEKPLRLAPVFPYTKTDYVKAARDRLAERAVPPGSLRGPLWEDSLVVVPRRKPPQKRVDDLVAEEDPPVPVVYLDELEGVLKQRSQQPEEPPGHDTA